MSFFDFIDSYNSIFLKTVHIPKETLAALTGEDAVVKSGGPVTADNAAGEPIEGEAYECRLCHVLSSIAYRRWKNFNTGKLLNR